MLEIIAFIKLEKNALKKSGAGGGGVTGGVHKKRNLFSLTETVQF